MSASYDDQNIFAKILRGEAPCVRVYEDDVALAFMDIMPRGPGHLLAIPKAAARNIFAVPAEALSALMPRVQKLAIAARQALGAVGVSLHLFNEAAGGQVGLHLHFHVSPLFEGVALKPPGVPMVASAELEPIAAKIRAALTGV